LKDLVAIHLIQGHGGITCAIRSITIRDNNQLEKGPRGKISLAWTFVIL
jgi:hypothetical protein